MKQPKFNFGDKVFYGTENPFVIEKIRWSDCYQQYEYNDNCLESVVLPYREPVKRKLYAYTSERGETSNIEFKMKDRTYYNLERMPEYDIDYDEAKRE